MDYAYDVAGNRARLAYPGASRVVNYTHDAANRISLIKDSANTVAQYLYVGPDRMSERKYMKASDGSTEVTTLHALYDGMANITRFFHDRADNSVVVGFQYDHDKMGNPQYKLREHQSNYGDEYTYDKLYRLTRTVYDDPTPTTPTASPAAAVTDAFGYDSIGNRLNCYLKSATATSYLHNPVNEYTKESTGGTDKYYGSDAAGNLTRVAAAEATDSDGDWRYYYDYENQMTKAEKYVADTWVTQGEYARDALMRRVEKVAGGTTIRFYHDGWQAIEETEGTQSPTVERQYVFGNGIDEALVMFRKEGETYAPYYYLADRLWTVEAIVNDSAQIVEAYAYRAYGEPTIKTGAGNDGTWFSTDDATGTASAYSNTITFTGRNYDAETEAYYFRMRMYDPRRGRFLSRDPLRYYDGMSQYPAYFVPSMVDPAGMHSNAPLDGPDPGPYGWHTYCLDDGLGQHYHSYVDLQYGDATPPRYPCPSPIPVSLLPPDERERVLAARDANRAQAEAQAKALQQDDKCKKPVACAFSYTAAQVCCSDTSETICCNAFSGVGKHRNNPESQDRKNKGPLYVGEYLIGVPGVERPDQPHWFPLYWRKADGSGYCGYREPAGDAGRTGFNLHPGQLSAGCVTVDFRDPANLPLGDKKPLTECWTRLEALVKQGDYRYNGTTYRGKLWVSAGN